MLSQLLDVMNVVLDFFKHSVLPISGVDILRENFFSFNELVIKLRYQLLR